MFRFITVENEEPLLDMLLRYLSGWFPGSKSDSATTVEDGLRLIRKALSERQPYDAAILDFKLPIRGGLQEEIDESLCREIQENMSSTLVVHFTGYPNDPKVLEHLEAYHGGRSDPRSVIIDKGDVHWVAKLRKKTKARLYGDLIEEQMEDLFGSHPKAAHAGMNMRAHSPSGCGSSLTIELTTLFANIAAHWIDLDETLKNKIKKTFSVDTESNPIRISLPL